MPFYSEERKAALLKMMLPPLSLSAAEVARREGCSDMSLHYWRKQAAARGTQLSDAKQPAENWSAESKLAIIIETGSLSELEIGEYCRRKGIFPEQITDWRNAFIAGSTKQSTAKTASSGQSRDDKNRIRELERELRRKDAALAETAALLVLRKKPQCLLGERRRGHLTLLPERYLLVDWLNEAILAGARRAPACQEVGISLRTLQRWSLPQELLADGRTTTLRPIPNNALSELERQGIVTLCNSKAYAHLPPSQIVPQLADEGRYVASEATFYRVLHAAGQQHHRSRAKRPHRHEAPTTYAATSANQVWSWDITYLPSPARGKFYYLYLIEDIYSRKAVGWEVYEAESGEKAAALLQRSVTQEKCWRQPLVLHSDNGAPMKSVTLLTKMYDLGITPSRGRPRVSNDNPYSESLFRTLKYCPQWPQAGFTSLDDARIWVRNFMTWYNTVHRHSRIRFVTPAQRHEGKDREILARRDAIYRQAREKRPERWSGETRNWNPIGTVYLNPERELTVVIKIA
ncbi:IS3 family transposase [Pseudomonas sp. FJ2-5-13]|uniref:IS3 family transposase n=1 Tax=Pseudomonas sp. FJ2-5-13 TaxID=2976884 RepID=UPI0023D8207D|nr:IS3 family transposase [Pseudomonas sp. FJ2-5-13]WEJ06924.1 IS3 family transposase [Pseudomonas sp. FJ2-5-13]